MRLRLPLAALALLLATSGCDSDNPGGSLADLDGTFVLETLVFDPEATDLADANVGARLATEATQLTIFAGDGDATLVSRFAGQTASRRTDLVATASRGRLSLEARTTEDREELADLLLPSSFSMTFDPLAPTALDGSVALSAVDLDAFDRERYQGLRSVRGTLRVRFSRL